MNTYTNIFSQGDYLYHFFVDDKGRKGEKIKYKPTLGVKSKAKTSWKDIYGTQVGLIKFESIREMYKWRKENEDRTDIYGDIMPIYQFISEEYPDELKPDFSKIKIFNLDIEVYSNEGFPFPGPAAHPVTAITVQDMAKNLYWVFGTGEYTPKTDNISYIRCKDEEDLLTRFIVFFKDQRPDIITGWNTELFDIPYLVNRAKKILPKNFYLKLSPVEVIGQETDKFRGDVKYNILGVQHIDYMKMYKLPKFKPETVESYALNFVCNLELGETKVDYQTSYGNLSDLYEQNYELFLDYNIRDVELVWLLNNKLRFLELIMTMAYMAKVNYEDAFGSVKIWEVMVFNELKSQKLVLSPRQKHPHKEDFPGGYVQEPEPGTKEWLTVWDITSSYPNQIISFNLSPETVVARDSLPGELKQLAVNMKQINGFVNLEDIEAITPLLKKHNLSMSANGQFFRRDKQGIFPQIVERVFLERKAKKKQAKKLYNELQKLKDELSRLEK